MNNRRKQRTMALIIALLIVVSSFNIGYDGVGIVKAEESTEITETVEGDGIEPSTEALVDESKKVTEEEIDDAISESELEETDDEDNLDSELDIISETNGKYKGEGYTVDFVLDSQWDSGYNATVTITNTSDTKIENWSIIMPLNNRFSNIWNAVVTDEYEDYYVIKNAGWNQDIPVNASVSFGISSNEKFEGYPEYYSIVGKKIETKTSDYKIEYKVTDTWEDGLIGQIKITNIRDKAIEDWRLHFNYSGEIVEIWDAVIVSHEDDVYDISCEHYNQNIEAGKSVTFGFKVSSGNVSEPEGLKLEEYSDGKNRYIAFMGEQVEEGILLSTICSCKCEGYVYYISKDGKNYSELDKSQECEFLYKDTEIKNGKLYFYVIGNTKNENFKSECVVVEYSNGECTIINYDTDIDLLCDYLEYCYGTDVENIDTDGDGLSDYYETEYTLTDPLLVDTDNDGISDYDMDIEGDGLKNGEEKEYGTNPASADTDSDNLTDYDEINKYGTDPLVVDTDGDELTDYDDIKLGFDPLLKDTDENGIWDGDEKVEQTVKCAFDNKDNPGVCSVSVSLKASGNIEDKISIEDMYGLDALSSDVVGLYGIPVEIQCDVPFDTAQITFEYDEAYIEGSEEDDLSIMWYNESDDWYQILDEDCVVDKEKNTISYTTTHFSTYMLVRSTQWYNAWRENIDYRSSEQGESKHSFDIAFVVDTSGSMAGDRMTATKTALSKFVGSMEKNDKAALVGFSSKATKYSGFTTDRTALKSKINKLKADGNTSVNAGLSLAYNMIHSIDSDNQKVIVLICDGDVDNVTDVVEKCKKEKIKIFVLNINNAATHNKLQNIAKSTGGEYYYGSSTNDVETQIGKIQGVTTDKIDTTDTDGDGLYDVIEKAGIRISNGTAIYTSYKKNDTDGDGLNDYNETGIVYNIDNRYIGKKNSSRVRYFKLRSNPTKKDSDNDGIDDSQDDYPWKRDVYIIEQLGIPEYLNVSNGHGGNQGWWRTKIKTKWSGYIAFKKDKFFRLANYGCGVIAMSDLELYLTLRNKDYKLSYGNINTSKNNFSKKNYMKYVEKMFEKKYIIQESLPGYVINLDPADMEIGLSDYLDKNKYYYSWVEWARYGLDDSESQKINVLEDTKNMLAKDIPVVFSYYDRKTGISMYDNLSDMKCYLDNNKTNKKNNPSAKPKSHYMTIIGVMKVYVNGSYKKILKVVSWGEIYYISYDEYAKHLNFFSNILSVY